MSRLSLAKDAVRPALKGRVMVAGPAGSGKTRTALMIAEVLAEGGVIGFIDTEKESALTYADDFTFKHIAWYPPFDPRELASDVIAAGGIYDVIVIDSSTHFWKGNGGTLDIANGKFTGWKEARPAQEDLVAAILDTDAHVIVCVRSKMKHEQVVEDGKHKVNKLGVGPVQDEDLEYEMNVSLSLDMGHTLAVAKSRTIALPVGREFKPGHAVELAELYRDWLKGGEPPAPRAIVDALVGRMNALPEATRPAAKQEFVAMLGRPEHLRESQVADAEALVARHETQVPSNGDGQHEDDPSPEPPAGGPGGGEDDAGGPPDSGAGDNPTDTPAGVDRANMDDPPASSTAHSRNLALNAKDVGRRASEVFRPVYDAAPPRAKTRAVDRVRHALVWACTDGTHASLSALDGAGLARVMAHLEDIAQGRLTYEIQDGDDGGVTWISQTGRRTTVMWSDAEMAHSGEAAA